MIPRDEANARQLPFLIGWRGAVGQMEGWIAELIAVLRLEFLPPPWRDAFGFGLRAWFACVLALYLAFVVQLDEPLWAAVTVWQVIQPAPGMAISKGFWRVVGVIIAMVVAVVLISLFSQAPELFILSLAIWVGACTVAATMLTNFRGFAGVSAGLMTAVIALDSYNRQDKVFDIAMARGAASIIGIACSIFVTIIFAPEHAQGQMMKSLRQAISDTARRVAFPLGGALADRFALGPPVVGSLVKLETLIEFAERESVTGRITASRARRLVAHLFAVITAKRALEEYLGRVGLVQDSKTLALFHDGMNLVEKVPVIITAGREADLIGLVEPYRRRVQDHRPGEVTEEELAISSQLVHDRLLELATHFEKAIVLWLDIQAGGERGPAFRLNFHRDRRNAAISGLRSFLLIFFGGIFWIESQWSSGPFLIIPMVVVSSIFASFPYPEAIALNFSKGVVCGLIAAYICTYHFLIYTSGFVPLAVSLAIFLIPAAMVQLNHKYTAPGLAFGIFFFLDGAPSNPMNFDPLLFFDNGLAYMTGAFVATEAYRLFMPPNPPQARRYLISRMREGLKEMARRQPIPHYLDWQARNFDRVFRLCDPANPSVLKTKLLEWYEGGLATMHAGNEILRMRHLLVDNASPDRVNQLGRSILHEFGKLDKDPRSTHLAIQEAKAQLSAMTPPAAEDSRIAWRRFRSVVDEMDTFFAHHSEFLRG